ncbi:hypothetical protein HCN51_57140, partial [Nonomuraea sp. FMUSA5-5]|nr:hypothetical protein [Nonomuraea sp. FMUSA5-5]
PYNMVHGRLTSQAGLRGGLITFGNGTIDLERAAFVPGVEVTGRITLTSPDTATTSGATRGAAPGTATASLTVTGAGVPGGRTYRVELAWAAFTARERPALSGSFDGTPFEVRELR